MGENGADDKYLFTTEMYVRNRKKRTTTNFLSPSQSTTRHSKIVKIGDDDDDTDDDNGIDCTQKSTRCVYISIVNAELCDIQMTYSYKMEANE